MIYSIKEHITCGYDDATHFDGKHAPFAVHMACGRPPVREGDWSRLQTLRQAAAPESLKWLSI